MDPNALQSAALQPPQFFRWSDGTDYTRGIAKFECLSFGTASRNCPACGRRIEETRGPGHARVVGGTVWPDFVDPNDNNRVLPCVSARVVEGLHKAGIGSFEALPVEIENKARKLGPPPWEYFGLVIARTARCDEAKSGAVAPPVECQTCGKRSTPPGWKFVVPRRAVLEKDGWKGQDLFKFANIGPSDVAFCTRRVLELARAERWTNCRFVPVDVDQIECCTWKGIDYLGKQWPPRWYPIPAEIMIAGGAHFCDDGTTLAKAFTLRRLREDGSLEVIWEVPATTYPPRR